ncbi:MAG: hypothetical protein ACHQ4J_01140 [Candidatus Binatia bacterium]
MKCLDGLHYSFAILEFVYAPLYDLCTQIPSDSSALFPALWHCWSFVDIVQRIREIAQAIPGLSGKDTHLKSFLDSTSVAEEFRHYIQHLRAELSKKQTNPFPVWGTLAWVDPANELRSHAVMIGARLPGTSYTGCVFDRLNRKWVSKVSLGVANKSLNFDVLYDAALKFREHIMPWALAAYQPGIQVTAELPIITMEFKLGADIQAGDANSET